MTKWITRALGGAAVLASVTAAASVTLAGTASAAPPQHDRFHEEFTETFVDYCGVPGLTVQGDTILDGKTLIHSGKNAGFMQHVTATFVDTNVANGNFITSSFHSMQRDKQATNNGDGTLTVLFLETGNAVVYGPNGKAIARNPGQVRYELLIDHGGTPTDPSDDEVIAFLGFVKESTGRTDDFCAAVVPVLT
jgi:hypothetical protein